VATASVAELNEWYREGQISPVEVTELAIAIAEVEGAALNAVAELNREQALASARESAARWAEGMPFGPLDGIPVSVKDSFPMAGLHRWHGSSLYAAAPPSTSDGAPVQRLREAGAALFAKTTMPDFGLLGSGVSSQFGIARNPWNPDLNPGGSSSGSGILLALGAGVASLGTDMGGSVRVPAALNGLVGLKPTQGRIAYDPPKLIGSAGPMARSVADVAALLRIVGQPHHADHLSLPGLFEWDGSVPESLAGTRVGLLLRRSEGDIDAEVIAAVTRAAAMLEAAGAEITPIDAPLDAPEEAATFAAVLAARSLPELLAVPESRWGEIPEPLREHLRRHLDMTAVEHVTNEKRTEAFRAKIAAIVDAFDYVLSPVSPVVSFPAEALMPAAEDTLGGHLAFTAPYNLTSMPAGTVPVTMSARGLPIGVQVGGRRFDDSGVLGILRILETSRGFDVEFPLPSCPPRI